MTLPPEPISPAAATGQRDELRRMIATAISRWPCIEAAPEIPPDEIAVRWHGALYTLTLREGGHL